MLIHLGIFSVMLECMVYIQQSQMVSVKVAEPEFLMQGGQQALAGSRFSILGLLGNFSGIFVSTSCAGQIT